MPEDKNGKLSEVDEKDFTAAEAKMLTDGKTDTSASIKASGDGLKYQWYIKNPGKDSFSKSSVTGTTYSCKVTKDISGREVYCKITDEYGNSVKTKTVTIKLSAGPKITTQPKGKAVGDGETANITIKASGSGLKYTWYIKDPGKSSFSKSSITTSTYSCTMTKAKSGRQIYCVVSDSSGKKVTSNTVTLSAAYQGKTAFAGTFVAGKTV